MSSSGVDREKKIARQMIVEANTILAIQSRRTMQHPDIPVSPEELALAASLGSFIDRATKFLAASP